MRFYHDGIGWVWHLPKGICVAFPWARKSFGGGWCLLRIFKIKKYGQVYEEIWNFEFWNRND